MAPPAFEFPDDAIGEDTPSGVQSESFYAGSRSSMLVVLDDDEYSTEEYRKNLREGTSPEIADEIKKADDEGLPPLPS